MRSQLSSLSEIHLTVQGIRRHRHQSERPQTSDKKTTSHPNKPPNQGKRAHNHMHAYTPKVTTDHTHLSTLAVKHTSIMLYRSKSAALMHQLRKKYSICFMTPSHLHQRSTLASSGFPHMPV